MNNPRLLLAAALLAISLGIAGCVDEVEAQSVVIDTVTWSLPTQRENGTAIAPSEISKTTIHIRASSTTTTDIKTLDVPSPGTSATITRTGSPVGTLCYVGTVTDSEGRVSAESAAACKTVTAPPLPPSSVTVR